MEYLAGIIKNLFGIDCKIGPHRDGFRLRVYSKLLNVFLEKVFDMPHDQENWKTPNLIEENEISWKWYMSGFFDAEGYFTKPETFLKTGKVKLTFSQNNKESLEFIKMALNYFGIKSGKIYLENGRKCHTLQIQAIFDIKRFSEEINLVRKKKNMAQLLDVFKDPIAGSL
ncbi:MAG: LAGLIDADG family homing endonuclease [Candidatus Aenigmarchaeota archaeon]|nr:LAGLIDADG family homing endonuclease [Candidatus Aenigmarchaeota archaeon]